MNYDLHNAEKAPLVRVRENIEENRRAWCETKCQKQKIRPIAASSSLPRSASESGGNKDVSKSLLE